MAVAAAAQQLAFVEATLRVDPCLVIGKGLEFFVGQELQLGNTNAVFTRNDAVQAARQHHDARHRFVGGLQHVVVVAVDGDVGVHVAVARVHVQGHPDAAFEHALVHRVALGQDGLKRHAAENLLQRLPNLGFPTRAQGVVLQLGEQRLHALKPAAPQAAHLAHQSQGLLHTVFEQLGAGELDPSESALHCAQRELREETGYQAAQWARAGVMAPTIGYADERIEIWFARGLRLGERSLDDGEFLDVFTATPAELNAWCRDGEVIDGKTLVGAWWWQQVASGQWPLDWQDA